MPLPLHALWVFLVRVNKSTTRFKKQPVHVTTTAFKASHGLVTPGPRLRPDTRFLRINRIDVGVQI